MVEKFVRGRDGLVEEEEPEGEREGTAKGVEGQVRERPGERRRGEEGEVGDWQGGRCMGGEGREVDGGGLGEGESVERLKEMGLLVGEH